MWRAAHGLDRLVRNPADFRLYAMWYESLIKSGARVADARPVIQAVLDHGYVTATEEIPFRDLDLRHLLDTGGYRHQLPSYRTLYQQTVLGRKGPPISFTEIDAYSVTHTIFYLSDFGARPVDAIPESDLPHVRAIVQVLLGHYLLEQDWDLVAELLLSATCLRWSLPPALNDAAWAGLLAAQREDGSVPGRSFKEHEWRARTPDDARGYAFEHTYHTTLATAIAGFIFLNASAPEAAPNPGGVTLEFNRPVSTGEIWSTAAPPAHAWLAARNEMQGLTIRHRLHLMLGLWIAEAGRGFVTPGVRSSPLRVATRRAAEALDDIDDPDTGLADVDAGLLLQCTGVFRDMGIHQKVLESHTAKMHRSLWAAEPSGDPETEVQPVSSSTLLASLGYIPSSGHAEREALSPAWVQLCPDPFRPGDDAVRDTVAAVLLAGAPSSGNDPHAASDALRTAIPAWAVQALRRYQLARAATFIRAARVLGQEHDPSITAAVSYFVMQQRPDGAFGFLAPEMERIASLGGDFQHELEITLPITVSVMWCLAELCVPGFRLFPATAAKPREQGL